ncbi:Iron-sulfur cluster assembly-like protein, mitochondrial [Lachnellula occidentalis]|uniref:Iron-sulfur cluster assembly-like protein, mitochondrial n=1 Tax=Lachnellula occidentalis TaxID=215460 RepID=A0A8H8SAG1_9HELO|nr:Iron-sulfur cluster assembly-like protein, mitochondrial [Lachnellula occidentalis]
MATQSFSQSCLRICTSQSTNAARAFLKLSPPRRHLSNFAPPPLLDFLLPPPSRCLFARTSKPIRTPRRAFKSSANRQSTRAIHNPQKDEDGNEMHLEITSRASNRLKEIMAKDANPSLALRIQVESGGCHGFQYLMSLTTLPSLPTSSTIQLETPPALNTSSSDPNAMPSGAQVEKGVLGEDDTVFEAEDGSGAKVVMDGPSLDLLKGSKVDFSQELIGSQFKIVDNPLATSSCGCGTSFDIKA